MTGRRWFCFCCGSALRFFWLRRIGMMADHRHHGEGEHDHGNVAMPAMPGSALVVIAPELVLGGLETVLDRPATPPTTQASLQPTLLASTIFESWLPMDSEIFRKGNCNARVYK